MDVRRNPILKPYDSVEEASEVAKTLAYSTKVVRFEGQSQVWLVPLTAGHTASTRQPTRPDCPKPTTAQSPAGWDGHVKTEGTTAVLFPTNASPRNFACFHRQPAGHSVANRPTRDANVLGYQGPKDCRQPNVISCQFAWQPGSRWALAVHR